MHMKKCGGAPEMAAVLSSSKYFESASRSMLLREILFPKDLAKCSKKLWRASSSPLRAARSEARYVYQSPLFLKHALNAHAPKYFAYRIRQSHFSFLPLPL